MIAEEKLHSFYLSEDLNKPSPINNHHFSDSDMAKSFIKDYYYNFYNVIVTKIEREKYHFDIIGYYINDKMMTQKQFKVYVIYITAYTQNSKFNCTYGHVR